MLLRSAENKTKSRYGLPQLGAICLLLLIPLAPNVFAADAYASVSYGTVQEANEIANPWYASATYGYTVKLVESGKLVRVESQTDKIIQGDCVAIDSSDSGKSIRRTNNSYCAIKLNSSDDEAANTADTAVKQVSHQDVPKAVTKHDQTADISKACQIAIDLMKQKDFGPERRKARQHAYQVCEQPK